MSATDRATGPDRAVGAGEPPRRDIARSGGTPAEFADPGPWNAPATYWFWHRIPTADEIRTQVRQMADAGYGSFQIQTRLAFPLGEYLSPDYLAACRLAADEAAAAGLMMGIYDEYNWLSGHAGGRVVAGHDELRERHLFHVTVSVPAGSAASGRVDGIEPTDVEWLLEPGMEWVFENGVVHWDEWELVAALGVRGSEPPGVALGAGASGDLAIADLTGVARLSDIGPTGATARVEARDLAAAGLGAGRIGGADEVEVTFFLAARCATSRMINYLSPDAARRFCEVGLEPYARVFGEHVGTTVRYVFFDQPHACFFTWRQRVGHVGATLMYDADFLSRFRAEHPGTVPATLLSLVRDIGPSTAARRCDFFEAYAAAATGAFIGTVHSWCTAHGLLQAGHEVLSHVGEWSPTGTIIADDVRPNFAMDYFSVDAHRDITGVDAHNANPQVSAKFGDSVARAHGRSGCIVEQYFGSEVPDTHFAAGQWDLNLGELRAQAMRHHVLGARQFLMHAFWLLDGDETELMFANPRFDFAPGVNFEPWFSHHRAFANESGRVSVFSDGMRPAGRVGLFYPLRAAWAGGPAHPFGEHTGFWAEHLARAGVDYVLIDERDLADAELVDGALQVAGSRVEVLVLPAVEVVRDIGTVERVEALASAGGVVLASGPLPRFTQADGPRPDLAARLAAVLGSAPRCRHWAGLPEAAEIGPYVLTARGEVGVEADGSGTLWVRTGRDGAGVRVLVFNDAAEMRTVRLRPPSLPAAVARWWPVTGEIEALGEADGDVVLRLDPFEVALLQMTDGERVVPAPVPLLGPWTLATSDEPRPIEPVGGWQEQGWPTFSGVGEYRTTVDVGEAENDGVARAGAVAGGSWELYLPAFGSSAEVEVNGTVVGRPAYAPVAVAIPPGLLRAADNDVRIRIASSAANRYYAGTDLQGGKLHPSGLLAVPVLRPVLRRSAG